MTAGKDLPEVEAEVLSGPSGNEVEGTPARAAAKASKRATAEELEGEEENVLERSEGDAAS